MISGATPQTPMDDNGLPVKSATAILRLVLILLFTNTQYFYFIKKQQNCNVNEENENFSADGSEYNAVADFLLFVYIYRLKYKPYQIKYNLSWCFVFIDKRKWGQFLKTPSQKLHKPLFSMWMEMLWQVQKTTGSWKYLSVDPQYFMFNSNLKYNIKLTTSFQDT